MSTLVYVTISNPTALLFDVVACLLCVTLYPYWRRGSVGQDSICVVIDPFPDIEPPRPDHINTDEDRIYHMLSYY